MKIIKITSRHRRDFYADMECENCHQIEKDVSGYDDSYFHQNVIPNMECKKCFKSTVSIGGKIENTQTKYPEGFQI